MARDRASCAHAGTGPSDGLTRNMFSSVSVQRDSQIDVHNDKGRQISSVLAGKP